MNNEIRQAIRKQYGAKLVKLYGEAKLDRQCDRYADLLEKHFDRYRVRPVFVTSPGRIEICGNHTDHNHGKVLASAIDLDTLACVNKTDDMQIVVESEGFSPVRVSADSSEPSTAEYGTSDALVKGIVRFLKDSGFKVGGFRATTTSDVPKAAGVSSSASFEILIAKIISVLYNDDAISPLDQAKAAHFAETVFFGKPCGLLDQMAIAYGGVTYMDFADVENPKVSKIIPDMEGYDFVLTATGGDHANLTAYYASIGKDMRSVANCFGKEYLRDVGDTRFFRNVNKLASRCSGRAILRAIHFFEENVRVDNAARALKDVDIEDFAEAVKASGDSSYKLLQNCYVPDDEAQRIPLALALTELYEGVAAVRVHGGGFSGTVLTVIDSEDTEEYVKNMKEVFGKENVFVLALRNYGAVRL